MNVPFYGKTGENNRCDLDARLGGQIFVRKATVVKPNIWKMLRMMGDLLFLRRYGCNYIWLAIKYKVQAFWADTG